MARLIGNQSQKLRRRALGQHFLTNPRITDKIVHLAEVGPQDTVLEIGPGKGILTESLLKTGCQVFAVEKDKKLAEALAEQYSDNSAIEIYAADFLKFDLANIAGTRPYKVVANLPYSVATEIIFKLIDHRPLFSSLHVMLQKEVAERLVAGPGTKTYGVLSVLTQLYSENKIVMKLPPGAFHPPPKVDSAVVAMKLSEQPRVDVKDVERFKKVVKQAFATRRKMLRNALQIKDDLRWREICSLVKINVKARAEVVSIQQFAELADKITSST